MVNYSYNAWGVVSSSVNSSLSGDLLTQANLLLVHNPYVYKGYYYDSETGYYYLKSRYYDPRIHRFISADKIDYLDPKSLSSLNLYVYCGDNPVMGYDPSGKWDWSNFWKILGTVAIVGGLIALTILTAGATTGLAGFIAPIVSSALYGASFGTMIGGAVGYMANGTQGLIDGLWNGAWSGAVSGAISGGLGQLQLSMKTYHAGKALFNMFTQSIVNGFSSMIISTIKGDSYEQAANSFLWGALGGFIGAKVGPSQAVAKLVTKEIYRNLVKQGFIQFGLQSGENFVNWINGDY